MKTKTKDILKSLKDTGRILYVDEKIAKSAPQNTGELEFFHLDRYITPQELADEYEKRGLMPASIFSLCEYDKTNREDLDKMEPVATQWKDREDKWCYAIFLRGGDEREVGVSRRGFRWGRNCRFAGVRKSSEPRPIETLESSPLSLESAIKLVKEAGYQVSKII